MRVAQECKQNVPILVTLLFHLQRFRSGFFPRQRVQPTAGQKTTGLWRGITCKNSARHLRSFADFLPKANEDSMSAHPSRIPNKAFATERNFIDNFVPCALEEGLVRTVLIGFLPPGFDSLLLPFQCTEPKSVHAVGPHCIIKGLDVGVVGRFPSPCGMANSPASFFEVPSPPNSSERSPIVR